MDRTTIRRWYLVHKWTSLLCTAFLLLLCVTGLPLIFHEELEDVLGYRTPLAAVPPTTPRPRLDAIVATVLAAHPGKTVQYMTFDQEQPVATLLVAARIDSPPRDAIPQPVDLRTGALLPPPPHNAGFLYWMEEAHERFFLGVPGALFLGAMGIVFLVAIVSGLVLYAPFMRRLPFGTVRKDRSRRLKWLDVHNLFGVAITTWLAVVTFTGVFNTLDQPLAAWWRATQLAKMTAPYRHAPPPARLGSVDVAVAAAMQASPGMKPLTIAWPGTFFSSPHHYDVFLSGDTPVTSKLLKPSLVDAMTGEVTDTRAMPLVIRALFLSQPLHFGDYGGLVLKIIWALLDLAAIVVLGSGLYLWLGRRARSIEQRVVGIASGVTP